MPGAWFLEQSGMILLLLDTFDTKLDLDITVSWCFYFKRGIVCELFFIYLNFLLHHFPGRDGSHGITRATRISRRSWRAGKEITIWFKGMVVSSIFPLGFFFHLLWKWWVWGIRNCRHVPLQFISLTSPSLTLLSFSPMFLKNDWQRYILLTFAQGPPGLPGLPGADGLRGPPGTMLMLPVGDTGKWASVRIYLQETMSSSPFEKQKILKGCCFQR